MKVAVEKSSSLRGISQCWRGVVQQQVELGGPERARGTPHRVGIGGSGAVPGLRGAWRGVGAAPLCSPPSQSSCFRPGDGYGIRPLIFCCAAVWPPAAPAHPRGCALALPQTLGRPRLHRGLGSSPGRDLGGQRWRSEAGAADLPAGHGHVPLWGSALSCRILQVQRFLEVAGQAPDLVERYCGLYQRLRGATEELFGQQAAFVLALGQGFAGALLQLSFLTTLHVSRGSAARGPARSCPDLTPGHPRPLPESPRACRMLPSGPFPQPGPAATRQDPSAASPVPSAGERAVRPLP